jgi:PAS domain S-box-containing protein
MADRRSAAPRFAVRKWRALSRPRRPIRHGWKSLQLGAKGVVLVAVPLIAFAGAAALSLSALAKDGQVQTQMRHAEQVQRQIALVGARIAARDVDQREFLALGDPSDVRATASDEAELTRALSELASLVSNNSSRSAHVAAIRDALDAVPAPPDASASDSADQAGIEAWLTRERTAVAKARQSLQLLSDDEDALLTKRRADAARLRVLAEVGVAVLLVIGAVGAFLGVRLFARGLTRRVDRIEADLDEAGADTPPDESADDLGRLARRLRETVQALSRRESELRDARSFLENVLTVGPVVVIRAVNGSVTYVSPNCERVLGLRDEDLRGPRLWMRHVAAEEQTRFDEITARLFEPDGPDVVEFEGSFEINGRLRHLSCLVTREAQTSDERGLFVYALDATARRMAENEGARHQRELSAITAASPDIIAVFTADLQIAFASEATTAITGYRANDRIGETVGSFVHDEDSLALTDAVRSVITGAAEDFTVRVRTRHVSGRYVQLEAHGRPLLGDSGEPVAAVAIFRDISERVALEAALVEARDAANAASKAKSEFLSRMSHELRTPLNVVLGFAQLLKMEPLGVEQDSWIEQILIAGRHLLDLINEVLDIARIESGALSLSSEPVSLRDVVGETVESMRPIAASSEISMDFLIEGDDLYVQADRQRLKQILLNLLGNSVKYNRPAGSVLVTCKVQDDRMTEIRVSDTGIGIAPENIERLFIPFDRLGAENSNVEGTGVGLPLSLRLVEAMDGDLSVESAPNEGSTFTVALPRALNPDGIEGDDAIAQAESQINLDADDGPRGTLLYVEDNAANLQLMQRVIARRPGIRLLHAAYGRMGLELARTGHADLVLLDLHLPDMTGAEVLEQLRLSRTTSDVPVYVVSADATAGQAAQLRAAGADGYLTKPLDVHRLLDLLDRILRQEEGAVAGAEKWLPGREPEAKTAEGKDDARSIS